MNRETYLKELKKYLKRLPRHFCRSRCSASGGSRLYSAAGRRGDRRERSPLYFYLQCIHGPRRDLFCDPGLRSPHSLPAGLPCDHRRRIAQCGTWLPAFYRQPLFVQMVYHLAGAAHSENDRKKEGELI